jgi:hypothetical protein
MWVSAAEQTWLNFTKERRRDMFGEMNVVAIIDLRQVPEEIGGSVDGAIARLLDVTEHPRVTKWIQMPKALFVFLVVPGDPDSGAFYVFDREARIWFWVDFDDEKFGGYTVSDFEQLIRECSFLDVIEHPQKLAGGCCWIIRQGRRPHLVNMDSTAVDGRPS